MKDHHGHDKKRIPEKYKKYPRAVAEKLAEADDIYRKSTFNQKCLVTQRPHAGHAVFVRKEGETEFVPHCNKDGKRFHVWGGFDKERITEGKLLHGTPAEQLIAVGLDGYAAVEARADGAWCRLKSMRKAAFALLDVQKEAGFNYGTLGALLREAVVAKQAKKKAASPQASSSSDGVSSAKNLSDMAADLEEGIEEESSDAGAAGETPQQEQPSSGGGIMSGLKSILGS